MAVTFTVTYRGDSWVITFSDGKVSVLPYQGIHWDGSSNIVYISGTTLNYNNCTSPTAASISAWVTALQDLRTGDDAATFQDKIGITRSKYSTKVRCVRKFGRNPLITTATDPEDIWSGGGIYAWPQAATTVRVKAGGDAADDAGGLGAQTIRVEGLDANWAETSEDITLAGASASSSTTETFTRVHRVYVLTCGTYSSANTGVITVENTAGTADLCVIEAGSGQSQHSMYTIPAGYTGYLTHFDMNVDSSNSADVAIVTRENADDVTTPFSPTLIKDQFDGLNGSVEHTYAHPIELAAKTDVWARATEVAGNTSVTVTIFLELVAD